jgi:dihydropteroate synthase
MTVLMRPRLLRSTDGPALDELRLHRFDLPPASLEHQVVLWPAIPPDLLTTVGAIQAGGVVVDNAEGAVVLSGPKPALSAVASMLRTAGFPSAATLLAEVVDSPLTVRTLRCRSRVLTFDRPYLLGILNVTPDSFFDGGRHRSVGAAIERAEEMEAEGADIIEIGGEKAGPGTPVAVDEELARIIPVLKGIRARSDLPISVDTRKPEVARVAAEEGADIANDINGARHPAMLQAVAETGLALVIVHIQGEPRFNQTHPVYHSVMGDIVQFLHERILECRAAGLCPDRIAIDPGPSFGKAVDHDLKLMRQYGELRGFPQPNVLAVSRKGFIGSVLNDGGPADRLEASLALVAYAMTQGADMVRTHDVAATRKVVSILSAVDAGSAP